VGSLDAVPTLDQLYGFENMRLSKSITYWLMYVSYYESLNVSVLHWRNYKSGDMDPGVHTLKTYLESNLLLKLSALDNFAPKESDLPSCLNGLSSFDVDDCILKLATFCPRYIEEPAVES
jgi:hypothetical protein